MNKSKIRQQNETPNFQVEIIKPNHKKQIIAGLVVVVLLIGTTVWYFHARHKSIAPQIVNGKQLSPEQQYHNLADSGNYKAAEQVLDQELAKADTKEEKVSIYFQQASVAIQLKNYADAKMYADKAIKLDPGYSDAYVAEAQVAMAENDKSKAKYYWQQAIDHLDPNRPGANYIKRDYQTSLDSLK